MKKFSMEDITSLKASASPQFRAELGPDRFMQLVEQLAHDAQRIECEVYHVNPYRHGWARIYVEHGCKKEQDGRLRYWVSLTVNSDYGLMGYIWSHCGEPYYQFLRGMSFDYAMNKMLGDRFMVFDSALHGEAIRKEMQNALNTGDISKDDYDEFLEALDMAESERDRGEFYHHIRDYKCFDEFELFRLQSEKPSGQATEFWATVWPQFLDQLPHQYQYEV